MRTKKIEERFQEYRTWLTQLQNRVQTLEQNQQVTTSRFLTEKELNTQDPHLTCRPTMHTDTYPLKDIIYLMLDLLGLEPKKTLEKIELVKLQTKKGKTNGKGNKA